jgi:hypothetical protein
MNAQVMPLQARSSDNNSAKSAVLTVLLGLAVGALSGWPIGLLLKARGPRHLSGWTIVALPLVMLLGLAWHEAGHVAAGLLGGFEFVLCAVGPLRLERHDGRLRASFNRVPMLWGGIAACVPNGYAADLQLKMILFAAGGPLFSLLGADDMHAVRAAVLIAEGRAFEAEPELAIAEQKLRHKPPAIAQWMREDIGELRAPIN